MCASIDQCVHTVVFLAAVRFQYVRVKKVIVSYIVKSFQNVNNLCVPVPYIYSHCFKSDPLLSFLITYRMERVDQSEALCLHPLSGTVETGNLVSFKHFYLPRAACVKCDVSSRCSHSNHQLVVVKVRVVDVEKTEHHLVHFRDLEVEWFRQLHVMPGLFECCRIPPI